VLEFYLVVLYICTVGVVIGLCFTVVMSEVAIYATARVEELECVELQRRRASKAK
jgi:hypothetical protein